MKNYPKLEIYPDRIKHNVEVIVRKCEKGNIRIAGVIKGANGIKEVMEAFINGEAKQIASSRYEQLKKCKELYPDIETMMIRIPMLSEVEEIIKYADYSVNSEIKVLEKLNQVAGEKNIIHKVILMVDLGDLREGYINESELLEAAIYVENNLDNLYLAGIGTNLGCYGSIKPTVKNLTQLVNFAQEIEKNIHRKLDIISGGATSSLPLLFEDAIPKGITHLRVGEGILLNYDLPIFWNVDTTPMNNDTFILKAEIIEKKNKPSYPIGEIFIDAFGNTPTYVDQGIRTKALLGIGKQDIGDFDKVIPLDNRIEVIGASSDHLIIDITNCKDDYQVGDIISFKLSYQAMLFATMSDYVKKEII